MSGLVVDGLRTTREIAADLGVEVYRVRYIRNVHPEIRPAHRVGIALLYDADTIKQIQAYLKRAAPGGRL